jgi:hypothetical protein
MYIFSANAIAADTRHGIAAGQQVPFIVYINFKDLFGAEHLCKAYLIRSGFKQVEIEKRKFMPSSLLEDQRVVAADKALQEAIEHGYMIRMFEE